MRNIRIEKKDSVYEVILQRPEVHNAFNPEMIAELTEAFLATHDPEFDCSVVLLRGEGKSFCSGADLGWMQSMAKFSFDENKEDSEKLYQLFYFLRGCPVPVVGILHGHVMGGAVGLAACCDIALADEQTQFCLSEVRLGLVPSVISPFLAEKIHTSFLHRYALTAEVFSATDALHAGLVHFVGSRADLESQLAKIKSRILNNGVIAMKETKALLRFLGTNPTWPEIRGKTTKVIAERRVSAEGQEGLRSFFEKRKPSWARGDSK